MKRNYQLLEKRRKFVQNYVSSNQHRQMKQVVAELSEQLFLSERTIYNIINQAPALKVVV
ncbi:hypothetical protein ABW636_04510 [Aquimarina sp. 2201CG1-2-11]|uniref:hypothetical protein n=1 Tax=Aquimarina discodermiae TaxID=3231043 RepID=UPI0034622560